MNVLNKGRCSRCLAAKTDKKLYREAKIKIGGRDYSINSYFTWLYCLANKNWCRNCALHCKEPPMGMSADDYKKLNEGKTV